MKLRGQHVDMRPQTGLLCIRHKTAPEEPLTPSSTYVGSYGRHLLVLPLSTHAVRIKTLERRAKSLGDVFTRRAALRTDNEGAIMLFWQTKRISLFLVKGSCRDSQAELSPEVAIHSRSEIAHSAVEVPLNQLGLKL